MFAGLDGCKAGWVCVVLSARRVRRTYVFEHFASAMEALGSATIIGVDMPIGLLSKGVREADVSARSFLRGQASSVFDAPVRSILRAKDHAVASQRSKRATGKGLSRQSFNLVPKIREVDEFADDPRIYEVHPEVSFRLASGQRLPRKKSWGGVTARQAVLHDAGIVLPDEGPHVAVGVDDVLDAAIVAWSARRIARGKARSFPEVPNQMDGTRRIAIWG